MVKKWWITIVPVYIFTWEFLFIFVNMARGWEIYILYSLFAVAFCVRSPLKQQLIFKAAKNRQSFIFFGILFKNWSSKMSATTVHMIVLSSSTCINEFSQMTFVVMITRYCGCGSVTVAVSLTSLRCQLELTQLNRGMIDVGVTFPEKEVLFH